MKRYRIADIGIKFVAPPKGLARIVKMLTSKGPVLEKYFISLMEASGRPKEVTDAVAHVMHELRATDTDKDPQLVANTILGCAVMYPHLRCNLVDGVEQWGTLIARAGEGVAIGLLEAIFEGVEPDPVFEARVFRVFTNGYIMVAFADSVPTPSGSGRLTNAIARLIAPMWTENSQLGRIRREEIFNLLMNWIEILYSTIDASRKSTDRIPACDLLWLPLQGDRQISFLEYFASELARKPFNSSPLAFPLYALRLIKENPPTRWASEGK